MMGLHIGSFVIGVVLGWLWGSGFFRGLMRGTGG